MPRAQELSKWPGFRRLVKKGRRLYGAVCALSDGRLVYFAIRCREQRYRSGEKSVNEAEAKGVDGWALDESTLLDMKALGVSLICFHEWDSGYRFVSGIADWDRTPFIDYADRGGSLQRWLKRTSFLEIRGRVKI